MILIRRFGPSPRLDIHEAHLYTALHKTSLFSVDEIHGADRDEISQLAASVQHFIREGRPIALIFAGLPSAVSDLLNEGVATFLRRACQRRVNNDPVASDES